MSRYINIDDISLRKTISVGGLSAKALWRRIQQEPSIDIVRCAECIERDDDWCMYWQNVVNVYDFCSYGVRKTNTTAEEKPTPIRDYMVHGEREGE